MPEGGWPQDDGGWVVGEGCVGMGVQVHHDTAQNGCNMGTNMQSPEDVIN